MSSYIINVTNGSQTGTVIPDIGFSYPDKLNDINEAMLKFSGTGSVRRGLLAIGSIVEIIRDGTREFYGIVENIDYLDGGGINARVSGYEIWLAKENGSYASSPYQSTASATIFGDIIAESNYFTAGTIEAGSNIDFRAIKSDSLWNSTSNLARKVSQDIQIDYVNLEVDILDHRGSSSSVATFNDGIHINNMRVSQAYPTGNNINVYGKGDGDNQITANASDATSISTYGTITRTIIDKTILSASEAQALADAELAITKDPIKVYDFNVINLNQDFIAGDVITLNSHDKGLSNEEVRIVGIERGIKTGKEYLTLQVTNAAYSSLMKTKNDIIATIAKTIRDNDTYMQGSGNFSQWKGLINGNNSAGLSCTFNVGDQFEDEIGNLRINSITVDYDVDEYRRGVGVATESNKHPDIDSGTFSGQDNESTEVDDDTTFNNAITFADSWSNYKSWTNIPERGQAIIFHVQLWVVGWNNPTVQSSAYARIKHVDDTDYYPSTTGIRLLRGATQEDITETTDEDTHYHRGASGYDFLLSSDGCSSWTHCGDTDVDTHDHDVDIEIPKQLNGSGTIYVPIDPYLQDFDVELDHTGSGNATAGVFFAYYVVSQHKHGAGDYRTENHKHDVSIGDDVSDAGSVNATEVNIYLDFWNGSAWVNKHSVLATGKTLDTDVDISDGGTYPDVKGYWKIRILTDSASPDLIQAEVNINHELNK